MNKKVKKSVRNDEKTARNTLKKALNEQFDIIKSTKNIKIQNILHKSNEYIINKYIKNEDSDINLQKLYEINLDDISLLNDLKYRLKFDSVTGIYNRDEFYKKTDEILSNNKDKEYDIVCLNVDRFKLVNDLFGMQDGDRLLKYIAEVIRNNIDFSFETCGRLYADNFALCIQRKDGYEDKMVELAKKSLAKYPLDLSISVEFGIYRIKKYDLSAVTMCDRANMAIEGIKGNVKKRYAFYEESHRIELLEEQKIINDMYDALKSGQFNVYFQPKYNLSNSEIVGAEALVRWIHPQKGIIMPDKFISLFEKCGFITIMDEYVWEITCKKIREWLDKGLPVVPISVNVSRVDIYNPMLSENLKALLKKYDIPINLLELEITETAYTENPSQLIEVVHELKKIGFTIEMDDFGTGYSSLNMLNEVLVDVLKLDLRFLKQSKTDGRGANIVNSVISMAKCLNLPVVIEGIETVEQAAFLRSIGCSKGQGYLFAKPMPHEEFEKILLTVSNKDDLKLNISFKSFIDLEEFWNPNSQINILFDSFVGGLLLFELRGNNVYTLKVNNRFYEMINIDRETMYNISTNIREFIVEEDKKDFFEKLEQAKTTNKEVEVETRFYNAISKEIMFIHARFKIMLNKDERTIFLASIDNYTDKKIIQSNFEKSEEKYEKILELTEDIVFEYDIATRSIFQSKNYYKKFGEKPLTKFPQSMLDVGIVKKEDEENFCNMFKCIENRTQTTSTGKFLVKNSEEKYIWCIISMQGIYNNCNNLVKIVGIVSDVDAMQRRLNNVGF